MKGTGVISQIENAVRFSRPVQAASVELSVGKG